VANILIVEDDKDLNNAYQLILKHAKHNVEAAFNGEEALAKLKSFEPDLILLDLLMPIKSGIDFLHEYDSMNGHPGVKIVVFTNLENSPEINEAFTLGADKCVLKSWTAPQGLLKVVDDVLKKNRRAEAMV
jgi:two-component system, OmpR family, response regulator ResD